MAYDEAEALDEMFEADEAVDEGLDEAARSWSRLRPKVASGRNAFTPRPSTQYVTQTQLQTALAKVGNQISINSTAINKVGGQVSQVMGTLKKEIADRKKDYTTLKNNLSQTQQMAAIMPLLTQPPTIGPTSNLSQDGIPDGSRLLGAGGSTLNLLLPLMLLTGIGSGDSTGSGGGGLFGGGDNSSMMMLVMVLVLSQNRN